MQSFKSRLARKKLTNMPKERVRIEGTTYQPYKYVVAMRNLIKELDLAGEKSGVGSESLRDTCCQNRTPTAVCGTWASLGKACRSG